jgi:hypothetical protein
MILHYLVWAYLKSFDKVSIWQFIFIKTLTQLLIIDNIIIVKYIKLICNSACKYAN